MIKRYCHLFFDEYPKDSRIRRYTNTLIKNNIKVFIICIGTKGKKYFEKTENLNIYRVPTKKRRSSFMVRILEYTWFEILSSVMVSYVFLRYRVSLFHVHTLPDFLVFSCMLPKIFGAKVILDFHELFPEFMIQHQPKLDFNSLLIKLIVFQERISFNFADEIIAFHDPAKEILERRIRGEKKINVIMNGVDKGELKEFNKRNNGTFNIVYNGTINYNLNLTLVVKALYEIKKNNQEAYQKIRFLIFGEGPDLKNILMAAKKYNIENIECRGQVSFEEMISHLEVANLCILPPKKDIYSDLFYSLKLLEMIFFRIPVIATKLITYQKYYPEGCLFYFESENYQDLAKKIIFVIDNPDLAREYTQKALLEYQKYSWDVMSERYFNLVKKV